MSDEIKTKETEEKLLRICVFFEEGCYGFRIAKKEDEKKFKEEDESVSIRLWSNKRYNDYTKIIEESKKVQNAIIEMYLGSCIPLEEIKHKAKLVKHIPLGGHPDVILDDNKEIEKNV